MLDLQKSQDSKRVLLARILVAKATTDKERNALIAHVGELNGKLHREAMQQLITSKGVLTPKLKSFLKGSVSTAAKRREAKK